MLSSRRYLRHTVRFLHDYNNANTLQQSFLRLCYCNKRNNSTRSIRNPSILETNAEVEKKEDDVSGVPDEVRDKLIYSEYLDGKRLRHGFLKNKILEDIKAKTLRQENYIRQAKTPVYSVTLESMLKNRENKKSSENDGPDLTRGADPKPVHMPYTSVNKYETIETETNEEEESSSVDEIRKSRGLNEEYKILYEKYLESVAAKSSNLTERHKAFTQNVEDKSKFQLADDLSKVPSQWMMDYEYYDDVNKMNYGTPEPDSDVSVVPCGGCGALLHCKDPAIPGYLPSELFLERKNNELVTIKCQRCHFMKHYNTSLAVSVSPDEYPKLLSNIRSKKAAVILLVDLMDFPCSIWPDILSIIGTHRPVFVVGNKVDLLPPDCKHFLNNVTESLTQAIHDTGINKANVKSVSLISAKTGYGIEQLINKLHNIWEYKGHVYLIGCTNSGKSTLFNVLLKSDYCKSQAVNLIQRATTSPWPGTTLNLLKFPILRPSGWRLSHRTRRLQSAQVITHQQETLRQEQLTETRNLKYAQLLGHVGRTFSSDETIATSDLHAMGTGMGTSVQKFGIDINSEDYKNSHWCFDTPGTVQPDQVIHLLTTEELMLTLPKKMITPRTFSLQPKQTLFLGGLGRLDYLNGNRYLRVTVFASHALPVTVCHYDDASFVYNELLKTEVFVVPSNDPERLKQWPELKSKDFEISGLGWDVSAADIILSSAGWISITPGPLRTVNMRAWTPEGRGIYLRTPALLPNSVKLRGGKIRDTPCYYRGLPVYRKQ